MVPYTCSFINHPLVISLWYIVWWFLSGCSLMWAAHDRPTRNWWQWEGVRKLSKLGLKGIRYQQRLMWVSVAMCLFKVSLSKTLHGLFTYYKWLLIAVSDKRQNFTLKVRLEIALTFVKKSKTARSTTKNDFDTTVHKYYDVFTSIVSARNVTIKA